METPWLNAAEQQLWRRWLYVQRRLAATLNRQLLTDAGLSLQDFDVLSRLTDEATGRIRITQLASRMDWERSRLSHHIGRMEQRGLVKREDSPDDGRGALVLLTANGRAAIERAAPEHVRIVRRIVFDTLTGQELKMLDSINQKVLDQLEEWPIRTRKA